MSNLFLDGWTQCKHSVVIKLVNEYDDNSCEVFGFISVIHYFVIALHLHEFP